MPLPIAEQQRAVARIESALAGYDQNTRLMILLAAVYGQGVIAMKLSTEQLAMTCMRLFDMHAKALSGATLERIRKLSEGS